MRSAWLAVVGGCTWIGAPTPRRSPDPSSPEPADSSPPAVGATAETAGDTAAPTPPPPEPLALAGVSPGTAGRTNVFTVSGATPGAVVALWNSLAAAHEDVPGCAGLVIDVGSPTAVVGTDGTAAVEVWIGSSSMGLLSTWRVVQEVGCARSEPLTVPWPPEAAESLDDVAIAVLTTSADMWGSQVAGAGDVNGDGFVDVIVGSPSGSSYPLPGQVALALGPLSGDLDLGSAADAVLTGATAEDFAGFSVSGAGDWNADGNDDLLIGAPWSSRAYVVLGPVSGAASLADADLVVSGSEFLGQSVAAVGDTDGDGFDDALVGAQGGVGVPLRAYLVRGPLLGDVSSADADAVLTGELPYEDAFPRVARAGDLDGDGGIDFVIGEIGWIHGVAYLVRGPVAATVSLADADSVLTAPDYELGGGEVAGAGDVDGDGRDDVLVGAPGTDLGKVYLVLGPGAADAALATDSDAILLGAEPGDEAGGAVAGAGDLDGDGHSDLIVGASRSSRGETLAGAAFVVRGPVAGEIELAAADLVLYGTDDYGSAAWDVASAGDIDGDGVDDLLVAEGKTGGRIQLVAGGGWW